MPRGMIDEAKLLAAALEEFGAKSYDDASINTILRASGVSKGSFYYRFATKYDFYVHILRRAVEAKWAFIGSSLGVDVADSGSDAAPDIFEGFLVQARAGARFALEHPEYQRLALMFSREKGNPVYARVIRELGTDDASGLRSRIDAAIESGVLRADLPRDTVRLVLTHMLTAFDEIFFADRAWDIVEAEAALEAYVSIMRGGLAARA